MRSIAGHSLERAMMLRLLAKEQREHGRAFLYAALVLMLFLICLTLLVIHGLGTVAAEAPKAIFLPFCVLGPPVLAFFVGHRLYFREWRRGTACFLAALPLNRTRLFLIKWFFGLAVYLAVLALGTAPLWLALALGTLLGTLEVGQIGVPISIAIPAYLFAVYALAVAVQFLGRYRILGATLIFFAGAAAITAIALGGIPFASVSPEDPLRFVPALRFYWLPGLGMCGWLFALAATIGCDVPKMQGWTAPMPPRQRFLMAAAFLPIALGILGFFPKHEPSDPPDPGTWILVRGRASSLAFERQAGLDPTAQRAFVSFLAEELDAMALFLDIAHLPPVRLRHLADLDVDKFELSPGRKGAGPEVFIHFGDPWVSRLEFLAWLIPRLLDHASAGRAAREPHRWLLDGFGYFWVTRQWRHPELLRQLRLRSLHGLTRGLDITLLESWLSYRRDLGEEIAAGLAWSGLVFLNENHGWEACRTLLQAKLVPVPFDDFRAGAWEAERRLDRLFPQLAGTTYEEFVTHWKVNLELLLPRYGDELARLPSLTGELQVEEWPNQTRRLLFRLRSFHALGDEDRIEFRYRGRTFLESGDERSFWRRPVDSRPAGDTDWRVESYESRGLREWNLLPDTFPAGGRLIWSLAVYSELLGCDIETPHQWVVLP